MLKADCAVVSWKLKNRRKNNKYTLHQHQILNLVSVFFLYGAWPGTVMDYLTGLIWSIWKHIAKKRVILDHQCILAFVAFLNWFVMVCCFHKHFEMFESSVLNQSIDWWLILCHRFNCRNSPHEWYRWSIALCEIIPSTLVEECDSVWKFLHLNIWCYLTVAQWWRCS